MKHVWRGRSPRTLWPRHVLVLVLLGLMAGGGVLGQEGGDGDDDERAVHDFTLSISPTTGSVVQGSSRTYTVEASIEGDGFDDEISLTISGLGSGLTSSSLGTLSSSDTSTTFTITASNSATLGSSDFTVTGTADNGLERTASGRVTVTARQPTSFSISPSMVRLNEAYTMSAGNAANMTLDLRYRKDGGAVQTITGWPTLDANGRASATPTLDSQVGSYVFTGYKNTQASTWISSSVSLVVNPPPDFEISMSPDHPKVYRGSNGTTTVTVTALHGFSSAVSLSVSGLPSGVTGSFSRTSVTPTGTSTLTIDVGSAARPGRHTFTVTGTGGGKTRTVTGYLVVPSFEVEVTRARENVDRGSTRHFSVTVHSIDGFSEPVTLSVSGLGSGVTGTFSRNQITPRDTVDLTISANCSATRGPDSFTVTGSGGGFSHSDSATVDVKGFSVSNTPETQDLERGSSVRYTTTVTVDSGFSSSVRLRVTGLPSDVTPEWSRTSISSTGTAVLRLSADADAALGAIQFTVEGTGGGCSDSDSDEVVVVEPPDSDPAFQVLMTPESGNVDRGSSRTYDVEVDPEEGFTSDVTLSVSGLGTGLTGSFSPNPATSDSTPAWTSVLTVTTSCNASLGSDTFTVRGDGGGESDSDSDIVVVKGFSLSAPAERIRVAQGTMGGDTITVTPDAGFTSGVTLSVSDLPTGVTGEFPAGSTRSASRLTLRAAPNADLGETDITVTGTAHGCPRSITVPIEITRPAFQVLMTPESRNVDRGSSRTYDVEVDPEEGFTSDVTLSVSGLGTGLTGSFSPNPATSDSTPAWTSVLTVTTSCNASLGSDTFTVRGSGGGESDSDSDTVVVKGFSLLPPPERIRVVQGTMASDTITVTPDAGFTSNVTLSVSDLLTGVTGSLSPTSTGSASTLTLTATSTPDLGEANITVTGSAHGCSRSITVPIIVTPPAFQVAVAPESADLRRGASVDYTVTVTPDSGFTSNVTLSVSDLPTGVTGSFSPNPAASDSTPAWTSVLRLTAASDATLGAADFTVTGTSGALSDTDTDRVVVTPACRITLDPTSLRVAPGSSGTVAVSVSLASVVGSAFSFNLSGSGLPTGVTGGFDPVTVTNSDPDSTLTLQAASSAAAATAEYTVTATGTRGSCTALGMIQVSSSGFRLSANPTMVTVDPDTPQTSQVTVTAVGGFSSAVTLGTSGLPTGVTGIFSPASVTPTTENPDPVSTLTVSAASDAAAGSYSFTITATGGSLTRELPATVVVAEAQQTGSFTLSVSPGRRNVTKGDRGSFTVTVNRTGGFSAPVTLAVSRLSSRNTPSFSVNPVPNSDSENSSRITVVVGQNASRGNDRFTITGSAAGVTDSVNANVNVRNPGPNDFQLTVSPTRCTIAPDASGTYTVSIVPIRGRADPVDLSLRDLAAGFQGEFSDDSIAIGQSSVLTVTAPANAPPGEETFIINATATSKTGSTTRQAAAATAEVPQPDFQLSVEPLTHSVELGTSNLYRVSYTVTVSSINRFSGLVTLSVLDLGPGLSAYFLDPLQRGRAETVTVDVAPNTERPASLTIDVSPETALGSVEITIEGRGGGLTRSIPASVIITGPHVPDPSSSDQEGDSCVVQFRMVNHNRYVYDTDEECGGVSFHTAPYGNWGVSSNAGVAYDSHQFQGWYPDDGWLQWNSCSTEYAKPDLDCRVLNFPDPEGTYPYPQNGYPFSDPYDWNNTVPPHGTDTCVDQISTGGFNHYGTVTKIRSVSAPVDTDGDGVLDSGGCKELNGESISIQDSFTTLYELDSDRSELVQTLYFPEVSATLNCNVAACFAVGDSDHDGWIDDINDRSSSAYVWPTRYASDWPIVCSSSDEDVPCKRTDATIRVGGVKGAHFGECDLGDPECGEPINPEQ